MGFLIGLLVFFLALVGFCMWRISSQGFSFATAKRWLLYIFTALLIIGVFGTCYFYVMSGGLGDDLFIKWMNIVLTAAFVFGYAIKRFWQFRRRWTFWVEIGVLIVAHFLILLRLQYFPKLNAKRACDFTVDSLGFVILGKSLGITIY